MLMLDEGIIKSSMHESLVNLIQPVFQPVISIRIHITEDPMNLKIESN